MNARGKPRFTLAAAEINLALAMENLAFGEKNLALVRKNEVYPHSSAEAYSKGYNQCNVQARNEFHTKHGSPDSFIN
jgi:hypothetical protein